MTASNTEFLEIAELGQPVLRQKATPVKNVRSQGVQKLIDDLTGTLMAVNGVGISAPQVFDSKRVFIVASHPNPRYPNAPLMDPTAVINPGIIALSKDKVKDWEGCLSIPGIRALVPRSSYLKIEYTDRNGKQIVGEYEDFIARIFQHEYDHLEGRVFLDRVVDVNDIVTEKEYQRILQKRV